MAYVIFCLKQYISFLKKSNNRDYKLVNSKVFKNIKKKTPVPSKSRNLGPIGPMPIAAWIFPDGAGVPCVSSPTICQAVGDD